MPTDFDEIARRTVAAIQHGLKDRLHGFEGVRRCWAEAMAARMGVTLMDEAALALVPAPQMALTDPVVFRHPAAWVVLDHAPAAHAFEDYLRLQNSRLLIHSLPRWWTLYEHGHPRFIIANDAAHPAIGASDLLRRLPDAWHGPFLRRPPATLNAEPIPALTGSIYFPIGPNSVTNARPARA